MKWMGWSWPDYLEAPVALVDAIKAEMREEAEELARLRDK